MRTKRKMEAGLSIRKYAEHRKSQGLPGGTVNAIQKAIAAGRITRNARGKIDPDVADDQWAQNTSPARSPAGAPPAPRRSSGGPTSKTDAPDYQHAKALRETALAHKAQLELAEMAGQLGKIVAMQKAAFQAGRTARDRIEAIPDRIDAILAAETDPRVVNQILRDALREALVELSDGPS